MTSEKPRHVRPRIILHGGAGNITRENLPATYYNAYRAAMLDILHRAQVKLQEPNATALDVATYAVSLLEDDSLFNSGHGAVFTTAGTHELEASVMVSHGYRKRGVGVMKVRKARNPIKLAREMLIRGEQDDGGGAGEHCQLEGETCDRLTEQWGLETVKPSYFWTRRRWDEHRRGLGKKHDDETYERHKRRADGEEESSLLLREEDESMIETAHSDYTDDSASWDGRMYLSQGTVGAVVLDSFGTICTATSTGGLTNKLPGRIGDTPTLGAGFWAEEWAVYPSRPPELVESAPSVASSLATLLGDCIPSLSSYASLPSSFKSSYSTQASQRPKIRAVGMSGTGNGDSFLKLSAVRTAAAIARYYSSHPYGSGVPLQDAVSNVAGPQGMLQKSAEDRWHKTREGEGGIIGIDFDDDVGKVVFDFNCGGMFRAYVDDNHKEQFAVFRDDTVYR